MLLYSHPTVVDLHLERLAPPQRISVWDELKLRNANSFTRGMTAEYQGVVFPVVIHTNAQGCLIRCYFSDEHRDIAALLKLAYAT